MRRLIFSLSCSAGFEITSPPYRIADNTITPSPHEATLLSYAS